MSTMNFARLRRAALGGLAAVVLALPAAAQTTADEAARAMSAWLQGIDAGRVAESWEGLGAAGAGDGFARGVGRGGAAGARVVPRAR